MEEVVEYIVEDNIIEGVGNEVLLSLAAFLIAIISIYFLNQRDINYQLHPEHVQDVQNFRQHVGRLTEEEIDRRIDEAGSRDDKTCAICISNAIFACLTNCGHIFCCECIVGYWTHRSNLFSPITCAICRTPVTLLMPVAWQTSQETETDQRFQQNVTQLDDYNRRFSEDRPWIEYIYDIPVLIPFLFRNLTDMNGIMIMFRLRVILIFVAVVAYTLMPLDIFPEGAYGIIGFLDDFFVAALMFGYLAIALRYFLARRWEAQGENA